MAEKPQHPLLARLGNELGLLGAELRESAVLRWQLAMLEVKADLRSGRRLAVALTAAGALGLVALPLWLVALAQWLDGCCGLSTAGWALVFGTFLALVALTVGWAAWHRFRRRFLGLEQTLEELREDVLWLQEWLGRKQTADKERPSEDS
ncbi:MAG: phage holin family protein [Pirellulales bacterium]|nr:phage holin family protein [Pirellulales bacterium]